MIYTIGYQTLTPDRLLAIVAQLNAVLIDVRARPVSRKPGFGFKQLESLFNTFEVGGQGYFTAGHHLGGRGQVAKSGIKSLSIFDGPGDGSNCVLMCMEHHPADCHRHRDITGPHYPQAMHIMDGLLFSSEQLAEAIAGDIHFNDIEAITLKDWTAYHAN